jgi:hypothetical protein
MVEEKKEENVEALLEKSLELIAPVKVEAPTLIAPLRLVDDRPTCSLIQDKPTRPYHRRNKHNAPNIVERRGDNVAVGFRNWAHERQCTHCSAVIRVAMSTYPRGTSGADWEIREAAILEGWEVVLRLSGHLQYTCPSCLLKVA